MNIADIVDKTKIAEAGAGASRIVKHIKDGTPFLMISAFRADQDHTTNIKQHGKMKSLLGGLPLSYMETTGEYHEVGADQPKEELSFFIMAKKPEIVPPETLVDMGSKLMHRFNQDSILVGDGEDVLLVFNDGSEMKLGNRLTFRPEIIDNLGGFSKIKGRKFSFTSPDTAQGAAQYQKAA